MKVLATQQADVEADDVTLRYRKVEIENVNETLKNTLIILLILAFAIQ